MFDRSFTVSLYILLGTIIIVIFISYRSEPVIKETNLENFPMEIADFKGEKASFTAGVNKQLNEDIQIFRHYLSPDRKQIDLYIGYYGTSKGGRTGHNPYACLPGAGWGIVDEKKVILSPANYANSVVVSCVLARKGDSYQTLLHWYQSDGNKVLSNGVQQNIQRFVGRILRNRDDGAYVQISVFSKGEDVQQARLIARSFAKKVLEQIHKYWPTEGVHRNQS